MSTSESSSTISNLGNIAIGTNNIVFSGSCNVATDASTLNINSVTKKYIITANTIRVYKNNIGTTQYMFVTWNGFTYYAVNVVDDAFTVEFVTNIVEHNIILVQHENNYIKMRLFENKEITFNEAPTFNYTDGKNLVEYKLNCMTQVDLKQLSLRSDIFNILCKFELTDWIKKLYQIRLRNKCFTLITLSGSNIYGIITTFYNAALGVYEEVPDSLELMKKWFDLGNEKERAVMREMNMKAIQALASKSNTIELIKNLLNKF